ncbi:hypothetical protein LFR94_004671 [Vibrio vulnificus]|uniref:hypothetical protein n=1 Tax=Vibrio TaxID=662 RepID=UPI001D994BD1|nr:hypothetical protein [Vibrio fluvialis]EGQ7958083.1 hypothetical protein [Vibrio vulnificus]EGQ7988668.1 hypothetical protein [Vibrio vulnificus]EGQ9240305.1 hypothetical protein [Vibrio vulnificus]EGR7964475.1 hypothetical protein [Vibrio vulnificus]EGR7987349.1 hypothetical protein [Vibrio vulnificus]
MNYWFGFRQLPDGATIACGPYSSADEANRERSRAKAIDAEVSQWLVADTEEEAQQRAAFFLENKPLPNKQG